MTRRKKESRKQKMVIALVVALVLVVVALMVALSQETLRHSDEVIARADRILAQYEK